jgi:hypothetical protein
MLSSLVDLFTAISDFEQIPSDWQNGIIKPIHKSGSLFELDNYRGITLSSNVYKVFSKVIEEKIVSYLEDNNILGESQGAFRKNRRLEDHVFTLQGICSLQKRRERIPISPFLTCRKLSTECGGRVFFISYGNMVSKVNVGACYGPFIRKSTTVSFSVITNQTGLVRIMV